MKQKSLLKYGKTYRTVKKRFKSNTIPYEYKVLKEIIFKDSESCCIFEKQLQNKIKNFSYIPLKSFSGKFECFKIESKVLIDVYNS